MTITLKDFQAFVHERMGHAIAGCPRSRRRCETWAAGSHIRHA